jgi:hypothetical protein
LGTSANALLSNGLVGPPELHLVDALIGGFTVVDTLGERLLATTTSDTDTEDNISLLGLVPEATSLVGASRARHAVDRRQVAVLPASQTEQSSQDVRLLLLVKLLEVFVSS